MAPRARISWAPTAVVYRWAAMIILRCWCSQVFARCTSLFRSAISLHARLYLCSEVTLPIHGHILHCSLAVVLSVNQTLYKGAVSLVFGCCILLYDSSKAHATSQPHYAQPPTPMSTSSPGQANVALGRVTGGPPATTSRAPPAASTRQRGAVPAATLTAAAPGITRSAIVLLCHETLRSVSAPTERGSAGGSSFSPARVTRRPPQPAMKA